MDQTEVFEKLPIKKAVWKLAFPTIMGMLITVFYNIVDTFFVGQTNDEIQVAAVSFAMPVFLVMIALGNLFGMGGSVLISRSLGEGKKESAKHISSFCFYSAIFAGIVWCVVSLIIMPKIVSATGASLEASPYVSSYLTYMALAAPFVITSNTLVNILRSEGASKNAMYGMMIGTITNIILDPIFILVLKMGVSGAAIATVIGNICSFIYYIYYLNKKTYCLSMKLKDFEIKKSVVIAIFSIGIPISITNLLNSAAQIIYNSCLSKYGDTPVAAMGIALKCSMLIFMVMLGLTLGTQPLVSYSYGAKNYQRMTGVIKYALKCVIIFGVCITTFYLIAAPYVVKMFIDSPNVIEIGTIMLRIQSLSGPILGIFFVSMSVIQSMGKGKLAMFLSVSRQGLMFIPILMIINTFGSLNALMFAQPIADFVAIIIAGIILTSQIKSLNNRAV